MIFDLSKLPEHIKRINPHLFVGVNKMVAKNSKYRAQRTKYNGRTYDSKFEAEVAAEFHLWKQAGDIDKIEYQVPFRVGEVDRYIVDFVLTLSGDALKRYGYRRVAVDAKGFATTKFRRDMRWWKLCGSIPLWVMRKGKAKQIIISELLRKQ